MTTTFKNPLADFRNLGNPSPGVQATVTTTAPVQSNADGTYTPTLVITNFDASMYAGTANQGAIAFNLIDGTSGGSNIIWTDDIGVLANNMARISQSGLNLPCYSGRVTAEFATAGGTTSIQNVNYCGYYIGYNNN